ncbi:MAG: hypothetical protein F4035_10355 [Acidimicrobiia bacterium]|nr:hypothetical protein [Acidimicrobiia bacterium]MYK56840.1 hypothetical protein [Acidimicrobiia bacterium]
MPSLPFENTSPRGGPHLEEGKPLLTDLRSQPPPARWGVEISADAVAALIRQWRGRSFPVPRFDYPGPPSGIRDEPWFDYAVLSVSVLACLWPPHNSQMWSIRHEGQRLTDAPALFGAITRWMGNCTRPDLGSFSELGRVHADRLFAGRGVLQMTPERGARLSRVATAVTERWAGAALHLVEEAGWDGPTVVELLARTIPGYEDEAAVGGHRLRFRKLAHLAASLMASRSSTPWEGMDSFPVYPDYMLPRVLRHLGVLRYSPRLSRAVDSRIEIPRHSPEEVAIRWATVYAGHLLVEALRAEGVSVTGPRLDYFLWWEAVLGADASLMGEHHRTVTLDY